MKADNKHHVRSTPNGLSNFLYYGGWIIVIFGCFNLYSILSIAIIFGFVIIIFSNNFQTKELIPWDEDPVSEYPQLTLLYQDHYFSLIHLKNKTYNVIRDSINNMVEFDFNKYKLNAFIDNTTVKINVIFNNKKAFTFRFGQTPDNFYIGDKGRTFLFYLEINDVKVAEIHLENGMFYCKVSEYSPIEESMIIELLNTKALDLLIFFNGKIDEKREEDRKKQEFYKKEVVQTIDKILKMPNKYH